MVEKKITINEKCTNALLISLLTEEQKIKGYVNKTLLKLIVQKELQLDALPTTDKFLVEIEKLSYTLNKAGGTDILISDSTFGYKIVQSPDQNPELYEKIKPQTRKLRKREKVQEEEDLIPDKGNRHALLISLFNAKKNEYGYVSEKSLKHAMMEEPPKKFYLPTDKQLNVEIKKLKNALTIIGGKYEIVTKKETGYKIFETNPPKNKPVSLDHEEDLLPNGCARHTLLISLFNAKKNGYGYVSTHKLKQAIKEELQQETLPGTRYFLNEITKLNEVFEKLGGKFKIKTDYWTEYKIVETEEMK